MGVVLAFLGKKADLCTQNARVMSKKAEKTKKMRKSDCICVCFCIFFTRLAVGSGFGVDILDRKSRRGMGGARTF
jgi:hypothetical protein